jgi:phytoene synthase
LAGEGIVEVGIALSDDGSAYTRETANARHFGREDRAVRDLVRSGDIDRYWSALYAPRTLRSDLLALYAFNLEIARIPALVSEPMVGQIRLQWWRDAIDLASSNSRSGNPIADRLAAAIRRHDLPKARLQAMVDARRFDLYSEPMASLAALTAYLDETAGALFALSAQVLGGHGEAVEKASGAAGLAYGLTALLRAAPIHAAHGRSFLPLAEFARGEGQTDGGSAPRRVRLAAERQLETFRALKTSLPHSVLPAFLILALIEPSLRQWERQDNPAHRPPREISPLRRFWLLWKAALTGAI